MHLDGPGIPGGESEVWRGTTRIPALPPTGLGGCQIIELTYTLQVFTLCQQESHMTAGCAEAFGLCCT